VELFFEGRGRQRTDPNVLDRTFAIDQEAGRQGAGAVQAADGGIAVEHGGSIVYGVRVLPASPALVNKFDLGLVLWA
jgi:hypothetical protein